MSPSARHAPAAFGSVCALIALVGCLPVDPAAESPSLPEQVLSSSAPRPPASPRFNEVEPNDTYATANLAGVSGSVTLVGSIGAGAEPYDRDLYDLGPAQAGDRVRAQLTIENGSDVLLALLDDHQRELGYIDFSSPSTGPTQIDVVLRESTQTLFIVAATRTGSSQARSYTARVTIDRRIGIPAFRPQVVVLEFQGASSISIGQRSPVNIPAFDAARIDMRYAGRTTQIVSNIHDMVSRAYEGLGVAFYLSTDPGIPAGPRSTVYFGTYDNRLLGLADGIDPYNANLEQEAILFTDTFSVFASLSPDVTAISQALANTTAHEVGHLLGLRHTADPYDLMDTTATARQMLNRQWFRSTVLNTSVLPIGYQDGPSRLSWTLGGILGPPPDARSIAAAQKAINTASRGIDFHVPRSMLMSGCSCDGCPVDADPDGQVH